MTHEDKNYDRTPAVLFLWRFSTTLSSLLIRPYVRTYVRIKQERERKKKEYDRTTTVSFYEGGSTTVLRPYG